MADAFSRIRKMEISWLCDATIAIILPQSIPVLPRLVPLRKDLLVLAMVESPPDAVARGWGPASSWLVSTHRKPWFVVDTAGIYRRASA